MIETPADDRMIRRPSELCSASFDDGTEAERSRIREAKAERAKTQHWISRHENDRTQVGWAGLGKAVLCEEAMISRQLQNSGGQMHERSPRLQSL